MIFWTAVGSSKIYYQEEGSCGQELFLFCQDFEFDHIFKGDYILRLTSPIFI